MPVALCPSCQTYTGPRESRLISSAQLREQLGLDDEDSVTYVLCDNHAGATVAEVEARIVQLASEASLRDGGAPANLLTVNRL